MPSAAWNDGTSRTTTPCLTVPSLYGALIAEIREALDAAYKAGQPRPGRPGRPPWFNSQARASATSARPRCSTDYAVRKALEQVARVISPSNKSVTDDAATTNHGNQSHVTSETSTPDASIGVLRMGLLHR